MRHHQSSGSSSHASSLGQTQVESLNCRAEVCLGCWGFSLSVADSVGAGKGSVLQAAIDHTSNFQVFVFDISNMNGE